MKTFALALPLAFATLSLAQLQGLPVCAQSCANIFLTGGIGNCGRDPACICADKSFIAAISCCLVDECAADDQQKAIDFAQQLCKANDVDVPNVVSCSSSTSPTASPTGGAQETTRTTTSGAAETTDDVSNNTNTTPAPSNTTPSGSGSASVTSTSSTTSSSVSGNGAAGARQTAAPVLGLAGLLAAAALL
ncbi:hypothetical protein GE09DRAFT_1059195 [Coniochaeta sp. 2T2.1]|nr:hypothetical protein GE09DRAFT_1059195 [Coniochaeta sp. 2T2.1]